MDIESLGAGAGTGFFGAILGYLGFSRRLNKLEDGKQDKTICNAYHENIKTTFGELKEGQTKIFDKIDDINQFLRNGK